MSTKIKICGVTRVEDALLAESLGADFIGLIFTGHSRRQVGVAQARDIVSRLTTAKPVGVFVEQTREQTLTIAREVGLAAAQHTALLDPKPEGLLYFRAVPALFPLEEQVFGATQPDYILLDTVAAGQHGGTGRSFDWDMIPRGCLDRTIIAGGITPETVAAAMAHRPYAVDLSSGVESAPGIKDHRKLEQLFKEIRHAAEL